MFEEPAGEPDVLSDQEMESFKVGERSWLAGLRTFLCLLYLRRNLFIFADTHTPLTHTHTHTHTHTQNQIVSLEKAQQKEAEIAKQRKRVSLLFSYDRH